MTSSLEQYVKLAAAHLDAAIVSPAEVDRILQIARNLPAVRSFGFECRLASPLPQADILLRFTPHDGSQLALYEHLEKLQLEGDQDNLFAWRAAREFCRLWIQASSPLSHQIAAVWLELDLFGTPGNLPAPCIFFDFAQRSFHREQTIRDILAQVHSSILSGPFDQNLSRCLDQLPASAKVFSLGAMFSRGPTSVRLCFAGLRPLELPNYLASIGWVGPVSQVAQMMEQLAPDVDWITVDLSLDNQILPKLGIELSVGGEWHRRQGRWKGLMNRLVAEGLANGNKRDAVLAWCGYDDALRTQIEWPRDLRQLSASSGGRALSTFLRLISHVKLVFQTGEPIEAKAYLEFMHSWLQRDTDTGMYFLNEVLSYRRPAPKRGDDSMRRRGQDRVPARSEDNTL